LPWYDAEMPLKLLIEVCTYTTSLAVCLGYVYHHSGFLDVLITSAMGALLTTAGLDHFGWIGALDHGKLFTFDMKSTFEEIAKMAASNDCPTGTCMANGTLEGVIFSLLFAFGVVFQCREGIIHFIEQVWGIAIWAPEKGFHLASSVLVDNSPVSKGKNDDADADEDEEVQQVVKSKSARKSSTISGAKSIHQPAFASTKTMLPVAEEPIEEDEDTYDAIPLERAKAMTVPELKKELLLRGDNGFGAKSQLVQRLIKRKASPEQSEGGGKKAKMTPLESSTKRKRL